MTKEPAIKKPETKNRDIFIKKIPIIFRILTSIILKKFSIIKKHPLKKNLFSYDYSLEMRFYPDV